jgi:hypothetical protein
MPGWARFDSTRSSALFYPRLTVSRATLDPCPPLPQHNEYAAFVYWLNQQFTEYISKCALSGDARLVKKLDLYEIKVHLADDHVDERLVQSRA